MKTIRIYCLDNELAYDLATHKYEIWNGYLTVSKSGQEVAVFHGTYFYTLE